MKYRGYGVHQGIYPSKYAISIFRAIVGYIKFFQKCGFWWYYASLVNWFLSYVFWQYKSMHNKNMNKSLRTHEQIVGNSWAIRSMAAPRFYGVILVLSADLLNSVFCITLIIFVDYLPRDLRDGLDFITTGLN